MSEKNNKKPEVLDLLGGTKKKKSVPVKPAAKSTQAPAQASTRSESPRPARKAALDLLSPSKKKPAAPKQQAPANAPAPKPAQAPAPKPETQKPAPAAAAPRVLSPAVELQMGSPSCRDETQEETRAGILP